MLATSRTSLQSRSLLIGSRLSIAVNRPAERCQNK
jgi:hypothetical protein